MHPGPSHYEIVGVTNDASQAELTAARNRLAREVHPDRNPHDVRRSTLRLQAVNAAYDALSDPERRRACDLALAEGETAGFEFICGDVRIASEGTRLRYTQGGRSADLAVDSISRVLVRHHALSPATATLLIVTDAGRIRFRLPRDAAEAVVRSIPAA